MPAGARAGLSYFVSRPRLMAQAGITGLSSVFGRNYRLTLAVLVTGPMQAQESDFGLVSTVLAVGGGVLGALLAGRLLDPTVRLLGAMAACGGLPQAAAGMSPGIVGLVMLVIPMAESVSDTAGAKVLRTEPSPEMRGRVLGFWRSAGRAWGPAGPPSLGLPMEFAGARTDLVSGGPLTAGALACGGLRHGASTRGRGVHAPVPAPAVATIPGAALTQPSLPSPPETPLPQRPSAGPRARVRWSRRGGWGRQSPDNRARPFPLRSDGYLAPMKEKSDTARRAAVHRTAERATKLLRPSSPGEGAILRAMGRLERTSALDGPIDLVQAKVRALPLGSLRDVLHGRWLGHPVHPLLVQVPLGSWLSAAVLDLLPGQRRAACALIGVGLGTAGPAALAGWVDWAELQSRQRRVGFVHAAANITAVALYAGSFTARVRGRTALGKALGFAGLSVVSVGGAIGGHLSYRQASGANHADAVQDLVQPGWHEVGPVADFPVGEAVRRFVDNVPVVMVRETGGQVHALADMCSHMGGPLSDGEVENGCLRCPWHGSVFRLSDGWNVKGPATAPQPAFDTRIVEGLVEARLRGQEVDDAPSAGPVSGVE